MNRIFFPLSRNMCATNIARFADQPHLRRFWMNVLTSLMSEETAMRAAAMQRRGTA